LTWEGRSEKKKRKRNSRLEIIDCHCAHLITQKISRRYKGIIVLPSPPTCVSHRTYKVLINTVIPKYWQRETRGMPSTNSTKYPTLERLNFVTHWGSCVEEEE
jgi:hypothetical protein